ncbi:cysteine methyltransferase [candidate division WWE3 bacterium CG_4_10_14_0_2_um_filter_42_8]|uniref:Cysteine methyltransferase n=1 Tax=candidate division WWE3 bacterium CG_4_10_14_0_2_um_filter_42_8 TaxID=1975074 RepID=A0A2M7TA19_UNCKA|nr:MAG: cysteine methyltransferase [candidate division WWE3 bacterium CG_4_10_14_0_2_um_filter_42_8]
MPQQTFAAKVYSIVQKIPKGRVATYGQVAALMGKPKAARAVGNALHRNPDWRRTPCHRVVRQDGRLAENFGGGGILIQAGRLKVEEVRVGGGKVDLKRYQWENKSKVKLATGIWLLASG